MAKIIKAVKTHNNNTLTESEYFGKIRSGLRRTFMYWKPGIIALENASRKYTGENKRIKKEYKCSVCGEYFQRKLVHIEHNIPCGSLRTFDDIVPFIQRLTTEDPDGFSVKCKLCHQEKTSSERTERKNVK
jgi:O6-methylguanine-DNA--protein-cysteine methyltransferase